MLGNFQEPVRVAVIFGPGNSIRPVWFDWRRRKYAIEEVTCSWEERQGEIRLFHFAVSDPARNLFELTYNATSHCWSLAAIETAG